MDALFDTNTLLYLYQQISTPEEYSLFQKEVELQSLLTKLTIATIVRRRELGEK